MSTKKEAEMTKELEELIKRAKSVKMTPKEKEQQRRSFAYGNAKTENDRITMATIDRAAELLDKERGRK